MRPVLASSLLAAALVLSGLSAARANPAADEQDQADDGEAPAPRAGSARRLQSIVRRSELGFHLTIAPGVFVQGDGSAGFSLGVHGRYGIDTAAAVISPGASLDVGFGSGTTFGLGLATLRATFPIGIFGPFLQVGLGWAQVFTEPTGGSVLYQAGLGFTLHFTAVRLGLEVFYQRAPDIGYEAILIGPTLAF